MGRDPRVTVVIPCHQYGRFLEACLASVLDQDGVDLDVLIIDDVSTDGSGEIVEAVAATDDRVRGVRHAVNQGHIATFNEGLAAADGDYLVLLSADDWLTPGSLRRATALMEAHPEVGLVHGAWVCWDGGDVELPTATDPGAWSVLAGADWLAGCCREGVNPVSAPTAVVRTAVHRQVGYRPELPHSADFELWLRLAQAAAVGHIASPIQALWRYHDANMSSGYDALADLRQLAAAFDVLAPELVAVAHARLARRAIGRATMALVAARRQEAEDLDALAHELYPAIASWWPTRRLHLLQRLPTPATRLAAHFVERTA